MRAARSIAAALFVVGALAAPDALGQTAADSFVHQGIDSALSILQDKSLSDAQRRSKLGDVLTGMLDLRRMAIFTLGPAAQSASKDDVEDFVAAYRDFALANYESQLGLYSGQTVQVEGATQRAPDDFVVKTIVLDPGERSGPGHGTEVDVRVFDESGKFALVDASVEGVWFTLAQRADFTGFLSQNGGSIPKLIDHLKAMTARFSAGAQPPPP